MEHLERCRRWIGGTDLWTIVAAMAVALLMILAATEAQGQTLTVLHEFTHGTGGNDPIAGLTMDRAGNFYGTTYQGGFTGGSCSPNGSGVVVGANGNLYGTTSRGGSQQGGVAWKITPSGIAGGQ